MNHLFHFISTNRQPTKTNYSISHISLSIELSQKALNSGLAVLQAFPGQKDSKKQNFLNKSRLFYFQESY